MDASGGTLTMDSNVVHTNSGGGILVTNLDFTITNNIVYSNGAGQANWGGVNILLPGSPQVFAHNTVVGNFTSGGVHAGVICGSSVELINSINWGNFNSGASTGCTYTNSWVEANSDPDPNLDPTTRKLTSNSGCIGFSPAYSGVTFDIDGQPRDPVLADTGADEYYP